MRQLKIHMNDIAKSIKENSEKPVQITITLPTHAYFMSGIRDFTLSLIRNTTDFSEQWAYRFQSVVDELCNNAIEHGSKPGEEISIIFINNPGKSIEIIIEDTGTGENPTTAEEMRVMLKERTSNDFVLTDLRGRGLSKIVNEWTDELDFEDKESGGLKVHVKKFLNDEKVKVLKQELSVAGDQTHIIV